MRRAHLLLRANQLYCASFSSRTAGCATHAPASVSAASNLGAPSVDCVGWRGLAGWARGGVAACSGRTSLPDSSACLDVRWQEAAQHPQSGDQRRSLFGIARNDDLSKQYRERRLVGYSPDQLFEVVADVQDYKQFVPWCQESVIVQRYNPHRFDAELEVGFKVFVERYTSEVTIEEPAKVISRVSDSTLFEHLQTTWEFAGGPTPDSCWLTFDIDFAFKSPLYGQLASVFFQEVVRRMMGAFEGRCRTLYGPSAFEQGEEEAATGN